MIEEHLRRQEPHPSHVRDLAHGKRLETHTRTHATITSGLGEIRLVRYYKTPLAEEDVTSSTYVLTVHTHT